MSSKKVAVKEVQKEKSLEIGIWFRMLHFSNFI
jgi:hypothetical protein